MKTNYDIWIEIWFNDKSKYILLKKLRKDIGDYDYLLTSHVVIILVASFSLWLSKFMHENVYENDGDFFNK
jgi:hypothetical protein